MEGYSLNHCGRFLRILTWWNILNIFLMNKYLILEKISFVNEKSSQAYVISSLINNPLVTQWYSTALTSQGSPFLFPAKVQNYWVVSKKHFQGLQYYVFGVSENRKKIIWKIQNFLFNFFIKWIILIRVSTSLLLLFIFFIRQNFFRSEKKRKKRKENRRNGGGLYLFWI